MIAGSCIRKEEEGVGEGEGEGEGMRKRMDNRNKYLGYKGVNGGTKKKIRRVQPELVNIQIRKKLRMVTK